LQALLAAKAPGDSSSTAICPTSTVGRAFLVEKVFALEEAAYHVNLNGQQSSCECKGFLHHGHCKHVEGLTVLVQAGKL
jgi:hypothetical protein